jgi:serine/threonine-protein kinase HipA
MTKDRILEVHYHGHLVGKLAEMPDKRIAFQYDSDWIRHGFSISPFSLPLREDVFIPGEKSRERFGGLFGVFADSLPDSWGRLLLDRYLESVGRKSSDISALERLAYVGRSGMGALEYYPSKEKEFDDDISGLDYDKISSECAKVLESKSADDIDRLYLMGGSSGGTRPKILISDQGKEWIVKFPAKEDPPFSGKREYDYSVCAKNCGIIMAETGLVPSSICEGYFRTVRFDRKNHEKIFMITIAGIMEADFRAPSFDYEAYLKLVRVLTKDNAADLEQLFRIMCFNVLSHNRDDHSKNFSFIYTDDFGYRLAPAYDLTYSDTYWGEQTTSVNGKGKDIKPEDILDVGIRAGLSKDFCSGCYKGIIDEMKSIKRYNS